MSIVAFDLGGTCLRCAVVSKSDVHAIERVALNAGGRRLDWEDIIECVGRYVDSIRARFGREEHVAFAFPGPLRREDGEPLCAPTVHSGDALPNFRKRLVRRIRGPVTLINDVSAAAWYLGERAHVDRLLVVTVSSGIGSKVFDRGHRLRVLDDLPFSGELGHLVVDDGPDAPFCDCGERGHLGAISSGRGTERLARRRAACHPDAFGRSACARVFGASAVTLTNEAHLVPAARCGDAWSWTVINDAVQPLARTLATAIHVVGAQRIALIGGFARALGSAYTDALESAVTRWSSGPAFAPPRAGLVFYADPDDEVCLRGAAEFVQCAATLI